MIEVKKPELLITAGSCREIETYAAAGADAVLIGEQRYGVRMPGEFDIDTIEEAIRTAKRSGLRVYVSVHNFISHDKLDGLGDYLEKLALWQADAIVFGDPAVLVTLQERKLEVPLHWDAEMTGTNAETANFWKSKGAARAVLARELSLEEIIAFRQHTDMEIQVQVHGMTNIYHSMRHLVGSYMDHLGRREEGKIYGMDEGLYLVEHERRGLKLPIFEDRNGTHIMSPDDICMIENLPELFEARPDSLKIESLLKSEEYNESVVRCYREAIDALCDDPESYEFDERWLETIERLQPPGRELTYGFYYKEQVY